MGSWILLIFLAIVCTLDRRVSALLNMSFSVDVGPHKVGNEIYCYCNIKGTNPPPLENMFNITIPRDGKTFYPSSYAAEPSLDFDLDINRSIRAQIEYNEEEIVCQVTTKSGEYVNKTHQLRVYQKEKKMRTVFINDSVLLDCPPGNTFTQEWRRTADNDGHAMNKLLLEDNKTSSEYYIDEASYNDEGVYECSEGTAVILVITLEIEGVLTFDVTPGPYTVGQSISIKCELPRVKGKVSETQLVISTGGSVLTQSQIEENSDGTYRLYFDQTMTVEEGAVITCQYHSPNGTCQERNVTISIIRGTSMHTLLIVGASLLGFTVLLIIALKCLRWKGRYHRRTQEEIQSPLNTQSTDVPQEMVNVAGPSTEGTSTQGPFYEHSIIGNCSTIPGDRAPKVVRRIRGPEIAQPYMIKVFMEPYYVNGDGTQQDTPQTNVERVSQVPREGPHDYLEVISSSSEESMSLIPEGNLRGSKPSRTKSQTTTPVTDRDDYEDMRDPESQSTLYENERETGCTLSTGQEGAYMPMDSAEGVPESGANNGNAEKDGDPDHADRTPDCCEDKDDANPLGEGPSEVQMWLRTNSLSQETCALIHREMIRKMSDFEGMTNEDILRLDLPLGEHVRLRMSLEKFRDQSKKSKRSLGRFLNTLKS